MILSFLSFSPTRPLLSLCSRSGARFITQAAGKRFTVLAVESSADDTCAAVVDSERRILSNVRIRQHELHEHWGGIHPAVAVMAHQRNMPIAVQRALNEAGMSVHDIDGIAFTRGPGIPGCLGVGCSAAKSLAAALGKPLVGVHHMQAHALTALLASGKGSSELPSFPFLTLLISGGHTLLLLATSRTEFKILATTKDESIGRTIDKVARLLGVWGVGQSEGDIGPGPALELFCSQDDVEGRVPCDWRDFPMPMPGQMAFSFASFHSHLERYLYTRGIEKGAVEISETSNEESDRERIRQSRKRGLESLTPQERVGVAQNFQDAVFGHLEEKIRLCFKRQHEWCTKDGEGVKHLVVSGGVASNQRLRGRLEALVNELAGEKGPITCVFPPVDLCTDNAAMIAWTSLYRFTEGDTDLYTIAPRGKWSLEDLARGDCGHENPAQDGLWWPRMTESS